MAFDDLLFKAEGKAMRSLYRLLKVRLSSAPYVSGDSFRALADQVMDDLARIDPYSVKDGDVLFVATHELERFAADVLPLIRARFVLITHNSDVNIDDSKASLADDDRIVRWFAQNVVVAHQKIAPIPIGLENRRFHRNGVVADFERLRRKPREKKHRLLFGFTVGTNEAERRPALDALREVACADEIDGLNSRAYRCRLAEYCFVASPPGNGIDCHRTWEGLYLGAIPVSKGHVLSAAFPGLPVVELDSWNDLRGWDEATAMREYSLRASALGRCEYLSMEYWAKRIDAESSAARGSSAP